MFLTTVQNLSYLLMPLFYMGVAVADQ